MKKKSNDINNMLSEKKFDKLIEFYKAIADSTRCKILFALSQQEMCVCDIGNLLGMTKSAISHQLSLLKKAKLVKGRKEGKSVIYSLDDDHVKDILKKGREHIEEI